MKINTDHIYICHYTKLAERKVFIEQQLKKLGIDNNYEFVNDYDQNLIDKKSISIEYPSIFNKTKRDNRFLRLPEISVALKHCYAIKNAYKQQYKSILILEDDATFDDDFVNLYNQYISELPNNWHLFWPGSCCNLHSRNIIDSKNIYQANTSRCCHCYSISQDGLKILIDVISFIDEAIDWYYNDIIIKYGLNTYWSEPAICFQNNFFQSTIQQ